MNSGDGWRMWVCDGLDGGEGSMCMWCDSVYL